MLVATYGPAPSTTLLGIIIYFAPPTDTYLLNSFHPPCFNVLRKNTFHPTPLSVIRNSLYGLWIGSDERLHRHENEFRSFSVVIMECLKKELLLNFLPWSKTLSFFKKKSNWIVYILHFDIQLSNINPM